MIGSTAIRIRSTSARLADAAPPDAAYLAIVVADEQYSTVPWDCPWPATWLRELPRLRGGRCASLCTPGEL